MMLSTRVMSATLAVILFCLFLAGTEYYSYQHAVVLVAELRKVVVPSTLHTTPSNRQLTSDPALPTSANSTSTASTEKQTTTLRLPDDITGRSCKVSFVPVTAYLDVNESNLATGDFFSQTDGKRIAEIYYGDSSALARPQGAVYTEWNDAFADCIQNGTIVWVDGDSVENFIWKKLSLVPPDRRIVVITGDSDSGIVKDASLDALLGDSRVLQVFAQNCDRYGLDGRDKFKCIPFGISQWSGTHGLIAPFVNRHINVTKTIRTLLSFSVRQNRKLAWDYFCKTTSFSTCRHINQQHTPADINAYFEDIVSAKFVVSPHGIGIDCWRTWEVLAVGGFVIVKRSPLDVLYASLPVWIVDDWNSVTVESLDNMYSTMSALNYNREALYSSFYRRTWMAYRSHSFRYIYT